MERVVIVLAILNVVHGAFVHLDGPQLENKEKQSTNEEVAVPISPVYLPASNNNPPPGRFLYPTYPDYLSNGYTTPGYEGYAAPKALVPQKTTGRWSSGNIIASLTPIINSLIFYGTRTSIVLLQFLLVALMGTAIIGLVCTYTSACNVGFLGLNRNEVKEQVTELARTYITPESLRIASVLVSQAIDKYGAENEKDEMKKNVTEAPSKLMTR